MTQTKNKKLDRRIQFLLVLVASLISTPGVYVGVSVRSELISGPVTPFDGSCLFCCRRAASELKVGRAILERLA